MTADFMISPCACPVGDAARHGSSALKQAFD
jgi:hypothetical protein